MLTFFNRAALLVVSLFAAGLAHSQTPTSRKPSTAPPAPAAKADKIMSIDELRTCMTMQQANEKNAALLLQTQDDYKRDQEAVKAEQADVAKASAAQRARLAALTTERETVAAAVTDLNARIGAAKKDEERAALEPERATLNERSAAFGKALDDYNAAQGALRDRVTALNTRIDALNARSKTVNDGIEPHKESVAKWREQCGSRRYREEDEIAIKKELAANK
ncbi:MAG: hypothetical protein JNL19_02965 [Burkholderiales bacterium]|nr:hypothetical protein [Burkholderiales bacterium]